MKHFIHTPLMCACLLLPSVEMLGGQAAAQPAPVTAADKTKLEELAAADIQKNLWTNLLSVADQNFTGDNQQLNLDLQDGIYRLNFDLGKKSKVKARSKHAFFTTFALKGSVPVSSKNTTSQLPTLNGLANGSTLELKFSRTIVPFGDDYWTDSKIHTWITNTQPRIISDIVAGSATDKCMDVISLHYFGKKSGVAVANKMLKQERILKLRKLISEGKLPTHVSAAGKSQLSIGKLLPTDMGTALACLPADATRSLWAPEKDNDLPWTRSYGASATIGQEDFNFTELATFEAMKVTETTYAFSVFGRLERTNKRGGTSLTAAIELQHAFKENEKSTECRDPDDMATCMEAIFGPPLAQDDFIAKLSYATEFGNPVFGDQPIAVIVNTSYDIDNDVFGIDAPIFLYRDDKNLGAGIRAGWRSDTEDFQVGFFVSQKFSL